MNACKINKVAILGLLAVSLTITGCQMKPGQTVGTLGGAAIGGLIGSTIGKGSGNKWAIGLGVLAGALAGGALLGQLDEQDKNLYGSAVEKDRPTQWRNPKTNHSGQVIPGRTIRRGRGRNTRICREVRMLTYVDGQPEEVIAYAYRGQDGQMRLVSSPDEAY
jgi:surface antigen